MTARAVRRLLALTATRADFGKLYPLLAGLATDNAFELAVFVTGTHNLPEFGRSGDDIHAAGLPGVFRFDNQQHGTRPDDVLATTMRGLSTYLEAHPIDALVVHGDRLEPMAAALVGALRGLLVIHVEGGEVSGTVDEQLRHAISKIAHRHFVSNDAARDRLRQLGEAPESIHVIGSPEVDVMLSAALPPLAAVRARYGLPLDRYGVLAFHPTHYAQDTLASQARELLDAVIACALPFVVVLPNNDRGGDELTRMMRAMLGPHERFHLVPHLEFRSFLTVLRECLVIVGNSSAGVREAPVFGVPSIDVGDRQQHRATALSIRTVPADRDAILAAIRELAGKRFAPTFEFGDGGAVARFLAALRTPAFWSAPLQKTFYPLGELAR